MPRLRSALLLGFTALAAACAEPGRSPLEPDAPLAAVSAFSAQILINEVMADPNAVSDDFGEWIELHNRGSTAVNVQGWVIVSNNDAPHTIASSVVVPAAGYVVLGRNNRTSKNGGVTVNYQYGAALTLANASDWIALRDGAGATVDSVTWASSMPAGATRGVRDPTTDNTDVKGANWSTATSTFGRGDRGTPGAQNDGFLPPAPAARLVINEIMADPAAVADADGEWVEVHNPGTAAVDLQGWVIASNNDAAHAIANSVTVPAGGHVVLARNGNPATNGGVTAQYVYGTVLTLANASDWIALRDPGGITADSVNWASAMPSGATRGVLDPSADNTNVQGVNWTTATSTFGAGDKGTPGAQNDGPPSGGAGEVVVRVLDIGQGDGNYITNGTTRVFIDGGPDTTRFRQHLDALGISNTNVDIVIISHAHFDHYSGLRELFKTARGITITTLYENKDAGTAVTLAELRDSINARVARGQLIYRDTDDPCGDGSAVCTVALNGGAKLHLLRPNPAGTTPNNRSGAVKLVGADSASFTMWFAGDAEHEEIDWFDATDYDVAPGMRVNVLKGDHHGSCNGIKRRYIELLNPDWVTLSLGASNTFGHVHTQTKDLLSEMGKPWYRTDQNGSIVFRSPGTAGGGYTATIERGVASMDGGTDATSGQAVCQGL